ncbi:ALBINO3-like protein 2, chloroplastic isoform X1 [Cucurbita pepo subsp. pepo]|uniref:ALBINO3-like protein 2, chloroplastic isoform X1 n=1 Tax=Cucurbita pepo subsp. pepo TaxID=3664 RepID=UPI000C9D904B|nr:ALBINO3-like protein 2, chloroplastic isoform X1 [Cucurbita pepo subsp. pepo]
MATSKLCTNLRRLRPSRFYSCASLSYPIASRLHQAHTLPSSHHHSFTRPTHRFDHHISSIGALTAFSSRSLWTRSDDDSEFQRIDLFASRVSDDDTGIQSGIQDLELGGVVEEVINATAVEESILPTQQLTSILDGFHQYTGLPWWAVIASSTLALRFTLLPLLIVQLNKLKRIGELFPKLPPPLPPPLSGRSYINQLSLFRKERKAIGCPSFLWFVAYFSIQVPCFLLWMVTIRKMSLNHHPGFDCGGALWFQNLTENPHGVLGPIFPLLVASLHFINVQVSFRKSSLEKATGIFGILAKYYKLYLNLLTVPLFFIGYCIPQGSLVYWVTNSSFTAIQQLTLQHPAVRSKLGLPFKDAPVGTATLRETNDPGKLPLETPTKWKKIYVEKLSPKELLALSVQLLSKGQKERAIPLLRQALNKDPEYVRALIVMGQTLLQNGQPAEAIAFLERAISKLFLSGHPTEVEGEDLLILASQWAGVASIRQGKMVEGIAHLERIANMKEPEEAKSKAHYYDGLVLLASALYNEGRKAEATKYLQSAAAYNPAYKEYLDQCEDDNDKLVGDLVSSRRGDY